MLLFFCLDAENTEQVAGKSTMDKRKEQSGHNRIGCMPAASGKDFIHPFLVVQKSDIPAKGESPENNHPGIWFFISYRVFILLLKAFHFKQFCCRLMFICFRKSNGRHVQIKFCQF